MQTDDIIEIALTAIYSNDLFNKKLYLKGGQALRVTQNIKTRYSIDADFSTKESFKEEYFEDLQGVLFDEFKEHNFYLFDFRKTKKPKVRHPSLPDFWSGWRAEFKLTQYQNMHLSGDDLRRKAITPQGAQSPKVILDISEHEYCESIEQVKIGTTIIRVYSRVLLILEKIRAICQQHESYKLRTTAANRARDYYDIERIYQKILEENKKEEFFIEAKKHLSQVFKAKEVPLEILEKIFDLSFQQLQEKGWGQVKETVEGKLQSFDYYNETLKNIVTELR